MLTLQVNVDNFFQDWKLLNLPSDILFRCSPPSYDEGPHNFIIIFLFFLSSRLREARWTGGEGGQGTVSVQRGKVPELRLREQ